MESDGTMNENSLVGVTSVVQDCVTPSLVDITVKMEKISSLEDTTILGSFPPLSSLVTTTADNVLGKSSYANVTHKPRGKKVNFRTLFTPKGNGIDVVVLMKSIHVKSKRFANTTYGFFLGKRVAYPVVANYVRNTWGKYGLVRSMFSSSIGLFSFQFSSMDGVDAILENGPSFIQNNPLIMKKWHPDVNLLKEDVSTVPVWVKLHGLLFIDFNEDGRSSYARAMIELCADMELKDNIVVVMSKITGEGYYTCIIRVDNKKKGVDSTTKVGDSNPFEVLNSVGNDVEICTNGETLNLDNNRANSSRSSFWNIKNSSTSSTPVMDKIRKFKNLVIDGQAILTEFGTQSLLEQWRDPYGNGDYDEDPYDDDIYEGHDLSEEIQSICGKLDIRVRGRKKQ
nr:hypothetical protein [Tanacetum cinerariifolium]